MKIRDLAISLISYFLWFICAFTLLVGVAGVAGVFFDRIEFSTAKAVEALFCFIFGTIAGAGAIFVNKLKVQKSGPTSPTLADKNRLIGFGANLLIIIGVGTIFLGLAVAGSSSEPGFNGNINELYRIMYTMLAVGFSFCVTGIVVKNRSKKNSNLILSFANYIYFK